MRPPAQQNTPNSPPVRPPARTIKSNFLIGRRGVKKIISKGVVQNKMCSYFVSVRQLSKCRPPP